MSGDPTELIRREGGRMSMKGACGEQQARVEGGAGRRQGVIRAPIAVLPRHSLELGCGSCQHFPVCDGTQMFGQGVPELCPGPAQAGAGASREKETNPKEPSLLWLWGKVWGWHSWSCPVSLQRNLFRWRGQSWDLYKDCRGGFPGEEENPGIMPWEALFKVQ